MSQNKKFNQISPWNMAQGSMFLDTSDHLQEKGEWTIGKSQKTNHKEEVLIGKLKIKTFSAITEAYLVIANEIARLIRHKASKGETAVLGLATGSTPIGVYNELVRMHQEEGLSFSNVITFNLDEYFPMKPQALQSYVYFMKKYLFDHVDINLDNVHIPDGTLNVKQVATYCTEYERKIEEVGGIDLQLLGIGRNGHIGFNEPSSNFTSRTRLVSLDKTTIQDASSDFFQEDNVPRRAITMGIGTIMEAKTVILMAWGEGKSSIVQKMVNGDITSEVPASFLQRHHNVKVVLDNKAAKLIHKKLTEPIKWDKKMSLKAVVWLCQKLNKSIRKLTDEDYNEYGLSNLVSEYGSVYDLNIQISNWIEQTITEWPGGKPNNTNHHKRKNSNPKRILIFSPHPDDDVISMGGTLLRLVQQGHEVHIAYQTSGSIAVEDREALRYVEVTQDIMAKNGYSLDTTDSLIKELRTKKDGIFNSIPVRTLKGFIRKSEATAAARFCGVPDDRIHFLNLPFYETGKVEKNPLGPADVDVIVKLLREIQPHQIYAAGDLADPHGTHEVCLQAIFSAFEKTSYHSWMKNCVVWLYRGAWQEWPVDEIEMAIPLSSEDVKSKRRAIFFHQSQKDGAMFQGGDPREFWQRAEIRNRNTAMHYNQIFQSDYTAMEGFVEHKLG